MLNLARAVQGVGGAAMFATSLALLAAAFHGRERGTAFGIWGATIGAAVAIGPLAGGALTETIGWESIFYINVPIGIAAIYISLTRVAESKTPTPGRTTGWGSSRSPAGSSCSSSRSCAATPRAGAAR